MKRTPKFELFRDVDGKHRWRLRAANGEIVAQSQAYSTKRGALRGSAAAKRAADGAVLVDFDA